MIQQDIVANKLPNGNLLAIFDRYVQRIKLNMIIDTLGIVGLTLLFTSLFLFAVQVLNASFMKKDDMNKYQKTSTIQKIDRNPEEQKYIEHTWDSYYVQKIRNFSFKIGIILVPLVLFINYITSTRSE